MSKAVLISTQPKWCELIASEKKTLEVRKTRPKMLAPFKCYIYCTQTTHWNPALIRRYENPNGNIYIAGKHYSEFMTARVIGEFVCDWCDWYKRKSEDILELSLGSLVQPKELYEYMGENDGLYGWHISDLQIYDSPLELSMFYRDYAPNGMPIKHLQRAPQSWCYVEEQL